ncbi:MAG TPA: POTRA domain-containing protein, partial [Anaeromyxobacteraceae bacterium]
MTRLPFLALALSLLAGAPARAAGAPTVQRIVVEGNRRVEADAVRNVISTKPGQPLDPKKLDEDLQAVMKLGFFADAVFEERGDPEHPTLVVRVTERPAVKDHRITGNEDLSSDDLKDSVDVKPFAILDLTQVKRSAKKIQEKYVEKGWY